MQLGNFSLSLAVKDLAASRAFYEKIGFRPFVGDNKTWLIMQNDTCTIGLHQGGLPKNSLTFNPGWDSKVQHAPRVHRRPRSPTHLPRRGLSPNPAADESTDAPAFLILTDPDGNPVIIDQHGPSQRSNGLRCVVAQSRSHALLRTSVKPTSRPPPPGRRARPLGPLSLPVRRGRRAHGRCRSA